MLASGAALFSGSVKDAFFDVFPNLMISDSVGSSETGFGGIGFATKGLEQRGGPKVGANRFTVVVDDDNRVLEPGSGAEGWLAKLGNVPLGYYNDPVKSAEIFREVNGARAEVTGDRARIEDQIAAAEANGADPPVELQRARAELTERIARANT